MSVVFKLSLRTIFHRLINHNTSIFTASHVPCTLQSETKTSKHHRISKQKESTYRPTVFRVLSCQFFIFLFYLDSEPKKKRTKKWKPVGYSALMPVFWVLYILLCYRFSGWNGVHLYLVKVLLFQRIYIS